MSLNEILALLVALFSAIATCLSFLVPHWDKKAERKFSLEMKRMDFYETRTIQIIESYVRSVNRSILCKTIDDEYTSSSMTIFLYVNSDLWHYVRDISFSLENGYYTAASSFLEDLCKDLNSEADGKNARNQKQNRCAQAEATVAKHKNDGR